MFRWKIGATVKITLNDGAFAYARLLDFPLVAFYAGKFKTELIVEEVVKLPVLFKVWCHKSFGKIAIKVGHVELDATLTKPVTFYKQDSITKRFYVYENGKTTPAMLQEVKCLECAAVWENEHILERLNAELNGKESKYKKALTAK